MSLKACYEDKGSQHWMQFVMNNPKAMADLLNQIYLPEGEAMVPEIIWYFPIKDNFKEYRLNEKALKEKLDLPEDFFKGFWAQQQPKWDAAFLTSDRTLYIVEAKAHTNEMEKSVDLSRIPASQLSRGQKINIESLKSIAKKYNTKSDQLWLSTYYQLANRLAFLSKLQTVSTQQYEKVRLILLNFANDYTYQETTIDEWIKYYSIVWKAMIGRETAPKDVLTIFMDVSKYKEQEQEWEKKYMKKSK